MDGIAPDGPPDAPAGELRVGDRFSCAARTVSERDIRLFADLTGDRHPQHLDPEWAKNSIFGERVAHGLLVLALSFGLVELDPERVIALRRLRDVVFKRPARIGEEVRAEASVVAIRPVREGVALVELAWDVIGHDDRRLLLGRIEVLWRLDEAGAAAQGPATGADDLFDGEVYL